MDVHTDHWQSVREAVCVSCTHIMGGNAGSSDGWASVGRHWPCNDDMHTGQTGGGTESSSPYLLCAVDAHTMLTTLQKCHL